MKRIPIFYLFILYASALFAQGDPKSYSAGLSARIDSAVVQQYRRVEPFFQEAYRLYPSVPRGVLEAVSYAYTRFTHLVPPDIQEDDSGVPCTYGLMGLTLYGRGFFRDNLRYVSELSGFSIEDIVSSPRDNVVAYAAAYAALQRRLGIRSNRFDVQLPILTDLSELPLLDDPVLSFALNSSLYAIAQFADNDLFRSEVGATLEKPDYERCFGSVLPSLRSSEVQLTVGEERSTRPDPTDYDGAIWTSAGTCNYSVGRGGHAISAVTIHYTQGTYAGSIAWFRNCTYNGVGAQASAHYVIRSSDGQVTQMVREADKAWHVGNSNPYTIGIEHEAYGDIVSYFTPEMYQSSARLVRDICDRNGISPHRMFYRDTLDDGTVLNDGLHSLGGESACVKIRGHQHFPNQTHTDPGPHWNWNYYYKLVNDDTPVTRFDTPSGTLTDSGGPDGDYGNDERQLLLIQVDGAQSITLSFSEFDLENDYDFLWIYDGSTVYAPLLGRWNTTSPGTVTSSGNAILLEFRSDCATTAAGWLATWQAMLPETDHRPSTEIVWDENQWVTENFTLGFEDTADGEIPYRFYHAVGYDGRKWVANTNRGFAYDDFDRLDARLWSVARGNWRCEGGRLVQSGTSTAEIALPLTMDAHDACMYEFDMAVARGTVAGRSAGVKIGYNGTYSRQCACCVAVFPDENWVRVSGQWQGREVLLGTIDGVFTQPEVNYHFQIVYAVPTGKIVVLRDGVLLGEFQGNPSLPLQNRSGLALFTSGTAASFDNLRVYRSRGTSAMVTVGSGAGFDLQWQAANRTPMAKVRSIVMDDQWSVSDVAEKNIRVDYTEPLLRGSVYVERSERELNALGAPLNFRWESASDPHSGVQCYEYGVAWEAGADATEIRWCGVTEDNSVSFRPRFQLPETYYLAVRAVNGAGLRSSPVLSETCGSLSAARIAERSASVRGTVPSEVSGTVALSLWPNPTTGVLNVASPEPLVSLDIYDACGQRVSGVAVPACYGNVAAAARMEPSAWRETSDTLCVDVSFLKDGIYFIRAVGRSGEVFGSTFLKQL